MKDLFLAAGGCHYTYDQLLKNVGSRKKKCSRILVKGNEPYQIFVSIVHSLWLDYPVELLDGDFSEEELNKLGIQSADLQPSLVDRRSEHPPSYEDVTTLLRPKNWALSLYTSGTTGRPKKVTHRYDALTRQVKTGSRWENQVWGFAYNPTHMAGLQVFFQAFNNKNTMIYAFGEEQKQLPDLIDHYQITHLSATATYYRNIFPRLQSKVYPGVKRVTFGGEGFDERLSEKMKQTFPHAQIRNVYASTEAGSVFAGNGRTFTLSSSIKDLVKINEHQELLIHHSLVGALENAADVGEWLNTGDVVQEIGENQFVFVSRNSDFINVGGYRVNPLEVEAVLTAVPGVEDAVVKGKKNSVTGNLLTAELVKAADAEEDQVKEAVRKHAADTLQPWKVPRMLTFVEEIRKTRTGKKVRE
ncbi:ANL family adenylate-forming protein [Halobacillus litoralis]|uniref:ANL family adenylate-forming protein n=1 Tax=Halobacillus litoralis TaxID=45668 RepID=UPI001CD2148A|nr:fatty acid--CoA ligase family protein [Halobacillus litoralis]MCA1022086.1 long-chain fatty acid--CoA ligase [Halobacillus litoralis]